MRYRPIDSEPEDERLGRFIPDDFEHIEQYPLTAIPEEERPTRVPVVIGVNWYREFDNPKKDEGTGEHWVAKGGASSLTKIRGGHCVCLEPGGEEEREPWWEFYDQGSEGACVGFGWSRALSMLNDGPKYAARWLWDRAKENDEWPQTNPGDNQGTSVRSGGQILRRMGHAKWEDSYSDDDHTERADYDPRRDQGIKRYRWAQSVDEVHRSLGNPRADELGAVPYLNSWGRGYPYRTWMPDDVLDRLMKEEGEVAIPTDR